MVCGIVEHHPIFWAIRALNIFCGKVEVNVARIDFEEPLVILCSVRYVVVSVIRASPYSNTLDVAIGGLDIGHKERTKNALPGFFNSRPIRDIEELAIKVDLHPFCCESIVDAFRKMVRGLEDGEHGILRRAIRILQTLKVDPIIELGGCRAKFQSLVVLWIINVENSFDAEVVTLLRNRGRFEDQKTRGENGLSLLTRGSEVRVCKLTVPRISR